MSAEPRYIHTQKGILHLFLLAAAAACLVGAWFNRSSPPYGVILLIAAAVVFLLSFAFTTLTIADGGDRLVVRFGPLTLFRKEIPYREIESVERTRSPLLAGLGIHWTPRGWLWNVGGLDCVRIVLAGGGGSLLGTDDPDGLLAFLRERIAAG